VGNCDTNGEAEGVAVSGNHAFIAARPAWNGASLVGGGLQVINISDPTNPRRIGGYVTRGDGYAVAVSGNYAYVATDWDGLQVIDISNPANPWRAAACDTDGDAWGVAVSGIYAYVADHHAGLQVIDISIPALPRRVGGNSAFEGLGVVVNEDKVFVAAGADGLAILDLFRPMRLQALVATAPGSFRFQVDGPRNVPLTVQRTHDLLDWDDWTSATPVDGPIEFFDPESATLDQRFFRTVTE
jgi:hypothetical protein